MPQSWSDWSNGNQNGTEVGPIFCPYPCFGLTISEQDGHGIVNLKIGFLYPDGAEGWTAWITENMGGTERPSIRCPAGTFATGIKVREQTAKGLVNIRLIDLNGNETPWATENQDGVENSPLKALQGNAITGLVAREQAGYEIVNVKIHYQPVMIQYQL
jgi:hypothetical protein